MTDSFILEAKNISIGYGQKTIGKNIRFSMQAGQIVCLLGPNGSGKSTLFKSLLGLIPCLSGEVLFQNQALSQASRRQVAQWIAYVPQAAEGLFAFEVLEVVLMGRSAHLGVFSSPSSRDRQLAKQCLERLGIAHLQKRIYTHLSGGEQQLVLLARALAQQPQLLVLDEPTSSLDFGNQIRVLEQISLLRQQGLTIFLCTHQPEHAYRIADQVLLFKNGAVVAAGPTTTILTAEALAELYDLPLPAVKRQLQNPII